MRAYAADRADRGGVSRHMKPPAPTTPKTPTAVRRASRVPRVFGFLGAFPAAPVPRGRLVLLGDNAHHSVDSRQLGYFPVARVLGVVLLARPHEPRLPQSMRTGSGS
ncbi:S26 family signal peptidase [Streptomyces spirodelae]|uniref:S26 family signal peptidase n=1 Tax=Streptomyces spirodelae TaxID=2812904 RepID=UPI0027DD211B|nr:S26 family signal peptidase [Streptomyces spirodelae]